MKKSGTAMGWTLLALITLGMMGDTLASIEDTERGIFMPNYPYGRGGDNDLDLARIFIIPQRTYHSKRNSELINSLLGLPKNMNNAGRK